jgi:hypothetical protein
MMSKTLPLIVASFIFTSGSASSYLLDEDAIAAKEAANTNKEMNQLQQSNFIEASSFIPSASAVTSGAWAKVTRDCSILDDPKPKVEGYNLNVCNRDTKRLFNSEYGSTQYTSCNFVNGTFKAYYSVYASYDCSGTPVDKVYRGTNGCDPLVNEFFCSADLNSTKWDPNMQTNYYSTEICDGREYQWSIDLGSYSSCSIRRDLENCNKEDKYSWKRICVKEDPSIIDTRRGRGGFCFHVDSKIDYKGVEYTYEELKAGKEPECTVPHSPFSKGVVISTSCDKTVRVTDTHLMATTKGFQLAYSLKTGDVMFGDYGKETCTVQSVEKEKTTQQYFGLNCVHSEVLASGLRASTFGDFHTLPSWYMTYVGGMIGSETASLLGEYITEWWYVNFN